MSVLFKYSYDYYEWENLIAVSNDINLLEKRYASEDQDVPLISYKEEHEHYQDREEGHFSINSVEFIDG